MLAIVFVLNIETVSNVFFMSDVIKRVWRPTESNSQVNRSCRRKEETDAQKTLFLDFSGRVRLSAPSVCPFTFGSALIISACRSRGSSMPCMTTDGAPRLWDHTHMLAVCGGGSKLC